MLTLEQLDIRAMARDFAAGEIRSNAGAWDAARGIPSSLTAKLAELGFTGMRIPESEGGLGLELPTFLVALEELAWGDPSVGLRVGLLNGPVAGLLMVHGTPVQRAHLEALATGDASISLALPDAADGEGGELGTTARSEGGGWILSGRKGWVIDPLSASAHLVRAVIAGEGDALFLIPAGTPGLTVLPRMETLGLRALEFSDLLLEEVQLPSEARIPLPAGGLPASLLAELRLVLAAVGVGLARSAAEHALRYAQERQQFGRPIAHFEAIQEKLGGMAARISAARALLLSSASAALPGATAGAIPTAFEGGELAEAAAMARLVSGETAEWVASQAVQIHGGYGYMRHYPVEKLMRDAQAVQILGGTVESIRLEIAASLLEGGAHGG
jgi:alkylation response protein AidB-like acyl-CoA dehydrogenase